MVINSGGDREKRDLGNEFRLLNILQWYRFINLVTKIFFLGANKDFTYFFFNFGIFRPDLTSQAFADLVGTIIEFLKNSIFDIQGYIRGYEIDIPHPIYASS